MNFLRQNSSFIYFINVKITQNWCGISSIVCGLRMSMNLCVRVWVIECENEKAENMIRIDIIQQKI